MEPIPEIIKSTAAMVPPPESIWKKRLPFFLFGGLVLIILVELVWGFQTYLLEKKITSTRQAQQVADLSTPQLVAQTSKQSYKIGETVPVSIKVVTGGNPTDSTDVVLKYDPAFFEAGGSNFFQLGAIYKDYPVAVFDNTRGIVEISGASLSDQEGFSGVGTLATLNFKARKAGSSAISFDFTEGSTADSNIVLSGNTKDLLSKVTNADIMIVSTAVTEGQNSSSDVCDGYFQLCVSGQKSGKQFCQKGKQSANQCVFDPKLTVSCGECQIE